MIYKIGNVVDTQKIVFGSDTAKQIVCFHADILTSEYGADRNTDTDDGGYILYVTKRTPKIRLHDLRHSNATALIQAGVNPKVVQQRLGHADVQITVNIKNPYEQLKESKQLIMYAKCDSLEKELLAVAFCYGWMVHRTVYNHHYRKIFLF